MKIIESVKTLVLFLKVLLLLIVATCSGFPRDTGNFRSVSSRKWDYQELQEWNEHYPACGGENQSPINIDSANVVQVDYPNFIFGNYDQAFREMVTNDGHTVLMSLNQSGKTWPYIKCGGLDGRYDFVQLHFHWGANSKLGSEHSINSFSYPAEMHLVHYNTKYKSFKEAKSFQDGLAVLGIMIELQARDNIAFRHLLQLGEIINPFARVKREGGTSDYLDVSIPLEDLLPDDTTSFFRYNGSLTTPGCSDAHVIWTVFETPIAISERQLNSFRQLRNEEGEPLKDNHRPIQKLHDRKVMYRPKEE